MLLGAGFGIRDSGFGIRDSGFGIREQRTYLSSFPRTRALLFFGGAEHPVS
ncbi:hypothetical protein LG3211_0134 [Lysobacter gummosus]|nr:hypothetical protein LG3211_0134 [Lysobacter gummosus]